MSVRAAEGGDAIQQQMSEAGRFFVGLAIVLGLAVVLRTLWLESIPQGTYIDELFTLRNTLKVMEQPFNLFGQTPLINEGWVETSNLYLNFNGLIVRLFGVSYLTVKLFSVIPGVAACVFFFLACTKLFPPRIALLAALLFVFSHWHIRLSRYGWDASFLVMSLTLAVWLLLQAFKGRTVFASLAGVAAGIGLYSYIAGRLCLLALGGYLVILALHSRQKADIHRLVAFIAGVAITIAPLLGYYLQHSHTTWVRVGELSIFSQPHPFQLLLQNIWGHALMFNIHGGTYARDNYPGLPMLDVVTGVLFLVGLGTIIWQRRDRISLLLTMLLGMTLLGGILSFSHEGAPYAYRTSAAVVPAILIAGVGLERVIGWAAALRTSATLSGLYSSAGVLILFAVLLLDGYAYFALERRNVSAMRIMGSEYRLMGEALRHTSGRVYLLAPHVFDKLPDLAEPGEDYFETNREIPYERFGREFSYLAVMAFSGRYDWHLSIQTNFDQSTIGLITEDRLSAALPLPMSVVLATHDTGLVAGLRQRFSGARVREDVVNNSLGQHAFTLVTVTP